MSQISRALSGILGGKGGVSGSTQGLSGNIDLGQLLNEQTIGALGNLYGKGASFIAKQIQQSKDRNALTKLEKLKQQQQQDFELKKLAQEQEFELKKLAQQSTSKSKPSKQKCKCKRIKIKKQKGLSLSESEEKFENDVCILLDGIDELDIDLCDITDLL